VPFRRTKACKNDHIANSVETIAFCIPVQSAENKRNTRKYLIDAKAKFFISPREVVGKAQYISIFHNHSDCPNPGLPNNKDSQRKITLIDSLNSRYTLTKQSLILLYD